MHSNAKLLLLIATSNAIQDIVVAANNVQEIKLHKELEPELSINRRYAGKQKAQWKSEVPRHRRNK